MKVRLESNDIRLILDTTLEDFIESMGYEKKRTTEELQELQFTIEYYKNQIKSLKEENKALYTENQMIKQQYNYLLMLKK